MLMMSRGGFDCRDASNSESFVEIEDDSRLSGFELRHADVFQQAVADVEGLGQLGVEPGVEQVEEDAVGVVDSLGFELHVFFEINCHPRVIRR